MSLASHRDVPHTRKVGDPVRVTAPTLPYSDGRRGVVCRLTRSNAEDYPSYWITLEGDEEGGESGPYYESELVNP